MEAHTKRLLDRLPNVAPTDEHQWEARCPVHDDRKASLCIGEGDDGRTLLYCQAGCDTDDVLRSVGLKSKDLFPAKKVNGHSGNGVAPKRKSLGKVIGNYDYKDERGELLYKVLRYDPKTFRQCRPDGNGGWIWNLKGVRRVPYRLPELFASKPGTPILDVEGEKDADRLAKERFTVTTNAQGVDGWDDSFADYFAGHPIATFPDNDDAGRKRAQRVARAAYGKATAVKIVELPGLPEKGDVSDWLDAGGTREQLIELIQAAPLWKPSDGDDTTTTPSRTKTIEEADDDPHRLARVVLNELSNLRYWHGEFYRYVGQCYVREPEIRPRLTESIKREFDRLNLLELETWEPSDNNPDPPPPRKVTCGLVANVELALQSLCRIPHETKLDSWLDGTPERSFVAVANGIVDIERAASGAADSLLPHSPNWFSLVVLPYAFDAAAACPKWLAFLAKNLEGDEERVAILGEFFGLCLVSDMRFQKFLLAVGQGANGKSVACAVLTALLGESNVSNVPLESFGERFQLMQTVGKLANIAAEIGEIDKVAEGHLKQFTSGDRMQFERKYRDPIEITPTARLVLATNNLPHFADRSSGLWRRMILMPFQVTIPEVDRINGMDQIAWWLAQGELPGIFLWALAGLKRLREQHRFTKSAVCDAALAEYRGDCNPAARFLRENYREHQNGFLTTFELYEKYRDWCSKFRIDKPLGERNFGKEIIHTFPTAKRERRGPRNCRSWGYAGICEGAEDSES